MAKKGAITYLQTLKKGQIFSFAPCIFLCAGILIYQSFASWAESPISTTIETLPIEKVKFPRISVCPPKNTFTSLNYDLMKVENSMFDEDQRLKFLNYVTEPIFDAFFKDKYSKV